MLFLRESVNIAFLKDLSEKHLLLCDVLVELLSKQQSGVDMIHDLL